MTKRIITNCILFIFLTATVFASSSRGQVTDTVDLRTYIERNAELLRDAELLVRNTNSAKARASLEAAYKLHEASIRSLENSLTAVAVTSAKRARDAILEAIRLAKLEARLEETANKAIERASRRNEQARALFDEAGGRDDVARKLIEESYNQLLRARANLREHVFGVSIQSADASLDMSNKAVRLLKKDSASPELVLRELERTDHLLGRVDERIVSMSDEKTSRLFDEAKRLQNDARTNVANRKYAIAFKETKQARTIARRIVNRTGGSRNASEETVTEALALTDELIERAAQIAGDNQNNRSARRALASIEEASRIQSDALDAYRTGHLKRALELTHRAREITRDTITSAQKVTDVETVAQALDRTDDILDRVRAALETSTDRQAADLFDRATGRQKRARDAFEAGALKAALANTKVAVNLANTALQRLRHE